MEKKVTITLELLTVIVKGIIESLTNSAEENLTEEEYETFMYLFEKAAKGSLDDIDDKNGWFHIILKNANLDFLNKINKN